MSDQPEFPDKHEADQASALLADILPPLWRRLYVNSIENGFSKEESFMLLNTFILQQAPHGVHFHQD